MLQLFSSAITADPTLSHSIAIPTSRGSSRAYDRASITCEEKLHIEELWKLERFYQDESGRIMNTISAVRTRFNATAPVSCLPDELLGSIFEALVEDHWARFVSLWQGPTQQSLQRQREGRVYCWIKSVLHVCHEWRRVATMTPQLWTRIMPDAVSDPDFIAFLLEHSGDLPLTFQNREGVNIYDFDWYERKPLYVRSLQSAPRMEDLALALTKDMDALLFDVYGTEEAVKTAPYLHSLVLLVAGEFDAQGFLSFISNIHIPQLRSLRLMYGSMEFLQSLVSPSLTRLQVSLDCYTDISRWLDVLDGLPSLQHLVLNLQSHVSLRLYMDPPRAVVTRAPVLLRSLKFIFIEGDDFGISQLLGRLVFPLCAAIELWSIHSSDFPASLLSTSVVPIILGYNASDSSDSFQRWGRPRAVFIDQDNITISLAVDFWRTSSPILETITQDSHSTSLVAPSSINRLLTIESPPRLRFSFQNGGTCLLDQYLDVLGTEEVLTLSLGRLWHRNILWYNIFSFPAFCKLETLSIRDEDTAIMVLEQLADLAESNAPTYGGPLSMLPMFPAPSLGPLPSLKTLILEDVRLDGDDLGLERTAKRSLFFLLRQCAQSGYRIRLLKCTSVAMYSCEMDIGTLKDVLLQFGIAEEVQLFARVDPESDDGE